MTLLPTPIRKEKFEVYSDKSVDILRSEMEEVIGRPKAYDQSINLAGKFTSGVHFEITPRWQYATIRNFEDKVAYLNGELSPEKSTKTIIRFTIRPNSIFPMFFFLFPVVGIIVVSSGIPEIFPGQKIVMGSVFIALVPALMLVFAYFAKKGLKDRFIQTFNLSPVLCFLLTGLILTSCNSSEKNPGSVTRSDTAKVNVLPAPANKPDVLTAEIMASFLHQASTISSNKAAPEPFNKLDYNKVIAYDYDGSKGEGVIQIIEEGKLARTVKQQQALSQQQADALTTFLGAGSTYGGTKAFCFEPHLGIVFYKDTTVVAHVSICLECNYLQSSVSISATQLKKIKIEDHSEYPAEGFSESGREKIKSLCGQLNFSNCVD